MKLVTAKTGLLVTILLVLTLMTFGFVTSQQDGSSEDCTISEKQSASGRSAQVNLKGVTRHLLDFYK
jgi:hypothetical protein